MRKKSLLAVAVCTAALAGASASAAFAGEVIGPPLAPGETGTDNVAATSHANSICVFSGLNDKPFSTDPMDPCGIVQSYGFSVVSKGFKEGFDIPSPGDTVEDGGCRGGSNPDREPPPAP
jgi:hypothetical protein